MARPRRPRARANGTQQEVAYVEFEQRVDGGATKRARDKAAKRALQRFHRLDANRQQQLGDAILAVNTAQDEVDSCAAEVSAWDVDTETAPHPTTAAECSAQQALVQALNALDVAWTQLRTLQLERKPSREFVLRHQERTRDCQARLQSGIDVYVQERPPPAPAGLSRHSVSPPPDPTSRSLPPQPPSASPPDAGWVALGPVGPAGGFAQPYLLVRQDPAANTENVSSSFAQYRSRLAEVAQQRVVVKDSSFNDLLQKVQMWKNRKWFWSRDRNNDLIPTEIKTMFDLRGRVGSEYIAKILSWRMSRQR